MASSIFEFLTHHARDIHLMTELLEACDWDDALLEEKIETFQSVLQVLPENEIADLGLEKWVDEALVPVLVLNGFTNNQASIMSKVILIKRDELQYIMSLGEQ